MLLNLFKTAPERIANHLRLSSVKGRGTRSSRRRYAPVTCSSLELLESRRLLSAQVLSSSSSTFAAEPSTTISVPVTYRTVDDSGQPNALPSLGLGFNLHYDSSVLSFLGIRNTLTDDLISVPTDDIEGMHGATVDNDPQTDRAINTAFLDIMGTFPNTPTPEALTLYEAVFAVADNFSGTSQIHFTQNGGHLPNYTEGGNFGFESQTVTLVTPAEVSIKASNGIGETQTESGRFAVSMTKPQESDTVVTYTVATDTMGGKFVRYTDTVTIPAGETSATIEVPLSANAQDGNSLTVTLESILTNWSQVSIEDESRSASITGCENRPSAESELELETAFREVYGSDVNRPDDRLSHANSSIEG